MTKTERSIARTVRDYVDRPGLDIAIDDVRDYTASVTVRGEAFEKNLHLLLTRDGWKIAFALWSLA